MLEPKIYLSNPNNKDFLYNGTSILPDLVNMTTVCRSDHTIQTAWSKEAFTGSFKKIA
jgi:hypothetical protein